MKKISEIVKSCLLVGVAVVFLGGCDPVSYPYQDTFDNPATMSKYRQFDQRTTDSYEIMDGHLVITATENQDLWGPTVPDAKRGAPLLLLPAPNEYYVAEAHVTATNTSSPGGAQALNTQVGLFVFRDEENWLFYGFTNHNFTIDGETTVGDGLIAVVTYNGESSIHHQWVDEPDEDALYLRLKKYGTSDFDTRYELKYKANQGDPWIAFAWTIHFPNPDAVSEEVGMGVKTFFLNGAGVTNPGLGYFDNFAVDTY